MKTQTHTEEKTYTAASFMDDMEFAPIAVAENAPAAAISSAPEAVFLDSLLAVVKWVFLFLPGAAAIHVVFMAMALLLFYPAPTVAMMAGAAGTFLVGMLMVMVGIGRFTDLRYLRVVGGISAASAIAAVTYGVSASFIPGDFYGWFILITMPLAMLVGLLVKRMTDREVRQPDE